MQNLRLRGFRLRHGETLDSRSLAHVVALVTLKVEQCQHDVRGTGDHSRGYDVELLLRFSLLDASDQSDLKCRLQTESTIPIFR